MRGEKEEGRGAGVRREEGEEAGRGGRLEGRGMGCDAGIDSPGWRETKGLMWGKGGILVCPFPARDFHYMDRDGGLQLRIHSPSGSERGLCWRQGEPLQSKPSHSSSSFPLDAPNRVCSPSWLMTRRCGSPSETDRIADAWWLQN